MIDFTWFNAASDDGTQFLLASQMIGKPWPIRARMNAKLEELEVVTSTLYNRLQEIEKETFRESIITLLNSVS